MSQDILQANQKKKEKLEIHHWGTFLDNDKDIDGYNSQR